MALPAAGLVVPAVGGKGIPVALLEVGVDVVEVPDGSAGEFGDWLGEVGGAAAVGER